MGRPKWNPDDKTLAWVVRIAERHARQARALASDDARRRNYHAAIEQDARASAFADLVREIGGDAAPDETETEIEPHAPKVCA
jgi:hypothetical protein